MMNLENPLDEAHCYSSPHEDLMQKLDEVVDGIDNLESSVERDNRKISEALQASNKTLANLESTLKNTVRLLESLIGLVKLIAYGGIAWFIIWTLIKLFHG